MEWCFCHLLANLLAHRLFNGINLLTKMSIHFRCTEMASKMMSCRV
uniref:Uncharacterized protein n=1 Tax=Tetranychus urticae TaxID=32264 RepID=T1JZ89_TETUR